VPEGIDQVLMKALAPVSADRPVSAAEFARVLQSAAGHTTGPTLQLTSAPDRVRRRRSTLAVIGLGILIGLGWLFAWRRTHRAADESGAKLLAVLPFENLGDSADFYFADGVANDLRTKLSQIQGVQVIARASSNEYRKTTKTQQQVARELGVDYVLTATVQWEKVPSGGSRVRVTPELVDVRRGHAPRTRWARPFDAAMTNVFDVQADIAQQVAQALNVALVDSTRRELATAPTENLSAYEAFLRGEAAAASATMTAASSPGVLLDPPRLRQAVAAYEQAIALDSSLFQAWAQLARAEAALYLGGAAGPARAEAVRRAAERALALAPGRPEGHQALGAYYSYVLGDKARALAEDSTALTLAPGNAELLTAVGYDELTLGHWSAARGHLEQAARLDPRSGATADLLGQVFLYTRRYPEAERAFGQAVQLLPENSIALLDLATVAVAQGDLARARAILKAAPKGLDPTRLVTVAGNYLELSWLLDESQQQLLLRLTPDAFDNDRAVWGMVLAQAYAIRGDPAKARAYADSSLAAYEEKVNAAPDEPQGHSFLGLAYAYLGRKAAAINEGQRAVQLLPISRDAYVGPYVEHQLARIYLAVGQPEKALDHLEAVLRIPYYLSPGWLKIDPHFDPLRDHPRFQRLVEGA
jgi:serine/threonine-protein kinase